MPPAGQSQVKWAYRTGRERHPPLWLLVIAASYLALLALIPYLVIWGPADLLELDASFQHGTMVVHGVTPNSLEAAAGLRVGDQVLAIDGRPMRNARDWQAVNANLEIGRTQRWAVIRDGKRLQVEITPELATWKNRLAGGYISYTALVLSCFAVGLFVALRRPHDPVARMGAWFLATASIAFGLPNGWAVLWRQAPSALQILFWIPEISRFLIAGIFLSFFLIFPRPLFHARWVWILVWVPVLATLPWRVSQFYSVIYTPREAFNMPAWIDQAIFFRTMLYLVLGIGILIIGYRRFLEPNEKRRVQVLVAGTAVGLAAAIGVAYFHHRLGLGLAAGGGAWIAVVHPLTLACPLAFAYAILRHRVFGIQMIIRQGLQYALARGVVLALVPAVAAILALDLALNRQRPLAEILEVRGWIYLMIVALALTLYWRRKPWLEAIDRRFFRERYDAQRLLHDILAEIGRAQDFGGVAPRVVSQIEGCLHPEFVSLMVQEPGESVFRTVASSPPEQAPPSLASDSKLIGLLSVLGKPLEVLLGDSDWLERKLPKLEVDFLRQARIDLLIPIPSSPRGKQALLVLGIKLSEEPYSRQDQELLEAIAASLGLLLEKRFSPTAQSRSGTQSLESVDEIALSSQTTRPLPDGSLVGTAVSHYRVLAELGRGGMGEIYLARDTRLHRQVALKVLPTESTSDRWLERFKREARTLAALDHPNIVTIHSVEEARGIRFLTMAYVEGKTLQQLIPADGLPLARLLELAVPLSEGLRAAHEKGIVHRDLKPSNVMVDSEGRLRILDFGLAKVLPEFMSTVLTQAETETMEPGRTKEGTIMGTYPYMSPEQAEGRAADIRSDLFSLGTVLYEMATGERPFQGETPASMISSILKDDPKPLRELRPDLPVQMEEIIKRCLRKDPGERFQSASELCDELTRLQRDTISGALVVSKRQEWWMAGLSFRTLFHLIRRPRVLVSLMLLLSLIAVVGSWYVDRQAKIRWAREEALPEIERLVEASWRDYTGAYELAEEAEKFIPNHPKLAELMARCSLHTSITTQPPGAKIYIKEYDRPTNDWQYLGLSPLEDIRVPLGIFRWKIEKEGYYTVLAAASSYDINPTRNDPRVPHPMFRKLDEEGTIPPEMVRVPGGDARVGPLDDFYIDQYEVTNQDYKKFIDGGGYRTRKHWKNEFVKDGKVLSWQEAMAHFVDQTGRPGPSTWQAGDYPKSRDDFPVTGISWYEAAAYADFVGKSLPTVHHWGRARGEYTTLIQFPQIGGYGIFAPFSNSQSDGPVAVGSLPELTSYGAFDMVGNVREWCWNETPLGRAIRGGAWNDPPYMFDRPGHAPPFERSSKNGFRCALYPEPEKVPDSAFGRISFPETTDFSQEQPVSDPIFEVYKERFSYDRQPLNAEVEFRKENSADWIYEKVSFDAAYGSERVIAHLFLPRNADPPYQTVIYFPGGGSRRRDSSKNIEEYMEVPVFLSFIVKNGRAALYPVYKGTFERRVPELVPILRAGGDKKSHLYAEFLTQVVKDFRRSVDYLETRSDIDSEKLAYYGLSWGASLGAIIPAIEDRLKVSVLLSGGFGDPARPEAHPVNYVTRVKIPTLMLNGEYDTLGPFETTIKPMFELLGTPDQHKKLLLYKTDHIPPRNEFIREILAWLDRYLGPVE